MRLALAQLAPVPGDVARNVERVGEVARTATADVVVFPELFLSGYRIGDHFHRLALRGGDEHLGALRQMAGDCRTTIVVGAPVPSTDRKGEIHNAVLAIPPSGEVFVQVKRYLPTFGPFEEGTIFTPTDSSRPTAFGGHSVGLEICYDAFFPEVSRDLALAGSELLIAVSAAPVTSRRLFDRVLPARAIENAMPMVYVNRVGVEDGIVFGGGSAAWDARGEPIPGAEVPKAARTREESVTVVEIDPTESARWRPFRPVLRDLASRPGAPGPPAG
jgi:predicted amidohydrolase